jgi:hypothetical protein
MRQYISSSLLKKFKGFLDELAQLQLLSLGIINSVHKALVRISVQIKDRQNLSVVWDKCLTNIACASNKLLQNL